MNEIREMPAPCLAFGHFLLDQERRVLLCDRNPVAVGQRGIRILAALLHRPGEVLTKAELMDAAWPGITVEESNLSVQIASLRKCLGQPSEGGEWIATIPRIGYRFLGKLVPVPHDERPVMHPLLANAAKPSLAVLPFANLSANTEDDVFADGLTQDIITTLSKLPRMTVIARHSTFAYRGRSIDVRQVARELDVRYVLEGSIRRAANRVRVTVQLNDANTGGHLWAERYDRELADIFAIEDEISLRLANEMQVHLTDGEQARLRYVTVSNVEAWSYWVRGQAAAWSYGLGKEQTALARLYWEKALTLDPGSASLNAILAFVHVQDARFRWWDDRVTALAKATAYVERALALDSNNADAYGFSSLIHLTRRHFDEAVPLVRKALELAPGSADMAVVAGWVLSATGHPREATVEMERAMKLNPQCPPLYYLPFLGNAYRLAGRTEEAIAVLEEFYARAPNIGLRDLVLAYERAGQHEKAKGAAARLLVAQPDFTIRSWIDIQFRSDMMEFEADIAALRTVGLPE
jgi:adenylate cyclase